MPRRIGHGGQNMPQLQGDPCWQPQPHAEGAAGVWQPQVQALPGQGLQVQELEFVFMECSLAVVARR